MSSVGVYQPVLFYMRSVQTILLLLVVPLFLALGRPLTLIIGTVPRLGPWLDSAIKSRAARLVTFPAITTFVLVLTPFLIYFTPWYAAGFRSGLVAQLDPPRAAGAGVRVLLDAAARRPGAEGVPVHRRALDHRRRGGRRRGARPRRHRRQQPAGRARTTTRSPARGGPTWRRRRYSAAACCGSSATSWACRSWRLS